MKNFKPFLLFIFGLSIIVVACDSDDDNQELEFESTNLTPTITADFDAIINLIPVGPIDLNNPLDIDITDFISFGQPSNISTRNYVSVVDELETITLGQPTGLTAGDIMWYSRVDYFDANTGADINSSIDDIFVQFIAPSSADIIDDPYAMGFSIIDEIDLLILAADEEQDVNTKYDIQVLIERAGTIYGYFTIDPKIRIKSLN